MEVEGTCWVGRDVVVGNIYSLDHIYLSQSVGWGERRKGGKNIALIVDMWILLLVRGFEHDLNSISISLSSFLYNYTILCPRKDTHETPLQYAPCFEGGKKKNGYVEKKSCQRNTSTTFPPSA